jgi:hypothetical protein
MCDVIGYFQSLKFLLTELSESQPPAPVELTLVSIGVPVDVTHSIAYIIAPNAVELSEVTVAAETMYTPPGGTVALASVCVLPSHRSPSELPYAVLSLASQIRAKVSYSCDGSSTHSSWDIVSVISKKTPLTFSPQSRKMPPSEQSSLFRASLLQEIHCPYAPLPLQSLCVLVRLI